MPRYRITIEYDGTSFAGWQVQSDRPTIQGSLVAAIARFSGKPLKVRGAGRTDAGVHALGQVAHFDLERSWEPYKLREAINHYLRPHPIVVTDCAPVAADFDARFSATARHYLYRILARRSPPALDRNRVWWLPVPLEVEAMQRAAQRLVGHHDFTTFRATACQAYSPVKTLDRFDVTRVGDEIMVRASARSFLHHQVRSMTGCLRLVGEGKWTADDVSHALAARDRTACGPVASPCGLYLMSVDYGPDADATEDADVIEDADVTD